MTIQQRYGDEGGNGHILEALGLYEAFQQLGIPVQIKHIHDFAWRTESATPQLVVLPHVSALSRSRRRTSASSSERGGHVLATGLTGFYDPMTHVWPLGDFPLAEAFGGTYKEVRHLSEPASLEMAPLSVTLPARRLRLRDRESFREVLCRHGPSHYGSDPSVRRGPGPLGSVTDWPGFLARKPPASGGLFVRRCGSSRSRQFRFGLPNSLPTFSCEHSAAGRSM